VLKLKAGIHFIDESQITVKENERRKKSGSFEDVFLWL